MVDVPLGKEAKRNIFNNVRTPWNSDIPVVFEVTHEVSEIGISSLKWLQYLLAALQHDPWWNHLSSSSWKLWKKHPRFLFLFPLWPYLWQIWIIWHRTPFLVTHLLLFVFCDFDIFDSTGTGGTGTAAFFRFLEALTAASPGPLETLETFKTSRSFWNRFFLQSFTFEA